MSNLLVEQIVGIIEREYATPITLGLLGARVGRQPAYLGHLFRQEIGASVREYVANIRLTHAAELIGDGVKIEAVALCVGYRSKKNFYQRFKKRFGTTPLPYRYGMSGGAPEGMEASTLTRRGCSSAVSAEKASEQAPHAEPAPDGDGSDEIVDRITSMLHQSNDAWRRAVRSQQSTLKQAASAGVAILLTDSNTRYVGANRAAVSLTGYSTAELRALSADDLFVSVSTADMRSAWLLMRTEADSSQRRPNAVLRLRSGAVASIHLVTVKAACSRGPQLSMTMRRPAVQAAG